MNITDKRFLALFSMLMIAWAIVYQEAILGMEAIWSRSDTFAHGYFILPISIWLLWRDKDNLLASKVSSTWLPLPILAASLFVWLFSYAADINVLGQLSAVISLICLIWLMVGNQLAWRYKFPLAYLIFAVPMGENLIPWLQDVTAWFTVAFLKINGIPVFVDGLYIQIPTGMFEVAVACSGIRYLIASIAVGTLFAYLTYHKTYKQIVFILFSIFLPILANGIRAYGIVAIAYYSDMKYATGVDHLVYGWLFFGVVIMLMFWIGGLFADKEPAEEKSKHVTSTTHKSASSPAIIAILLIATTLMLLNNVQIVSKPLKPEIALTKSESFNEVEQSTWGITFNNALQRSHLISPAGLEVFRAVFAHKQSKGELISWENIIFEEKKWTLINSETIQLHGHNAKLLLIRNIAGKERSILYWYDIAGKAFVNGTKAKLMQAVEVYKTPNSQAEIVAFSKVDTSKEALIAQAEVYLSNFPNVKVMAN
ncbi:MAG: exosortase A [Colwellia sp.]|nr:exosortase A [Colwellia sp.]MCW8866492.1 exosortase A [Colwellia sp.]MCW9080681.1 exosortase A [Colwellia sp.]